MSDLLRFIGKKYWLNTKISIFWRFWPQNVTFYCPTLVMNCKKLLFLFTFPILLYTLCCPKVIFWWFGRSYWWEIFINTKITIFWRFWPQNVTFYRPTLVMNCKKSLFFFTFPIVPCTFCCLKVIFWWFGKIHWGEILIKYQNTYILTILAQKSDPLPPYPCRE